jgi:hypothetical protein
MRAYNMTNMEAMTLFSMMPVTYSKMLGQLQQGHIQAVRDWQVRALIAAHADMRVQKAHNLSHTQVYRRMGHQCNDTILSASVMLTPANPSPCASDVMEIKPIFHSEFGLCHQIIVNTSIPKLSNVRYEGAASSVAHTAHTQVRLVASACC